MRLFTILAATSIFQAYSITFCECTPPSGTTSSNEISVDSEAGQGTEAQTQFSIENSILVGYYGTCLPRSQLSPSGPTMFKPKQTASNKIRQLGNRFYVYDSFGVAKLKGTDACMTRLEISRRQPKPLPPASAVVCSIYFTNPSLLPSIRKLYVAPNAKTKNGVEKVWYDEDLISTVERHYFPQSVADGGIVRFARMDPGAENLKLRRVIVSDKYVSAWPEDLLTHLRAVCVKNLDTMNNGRFGEVVGYDDIFMNGKDGIGNMWGVIKGVKKA